MQTSLNGCPVGRVQVSLVGPPYVAAPTELGFTTPFEQVMPVKLVLMVLPKLLVLLPRLLPPTKLEEPLHGLLIVLDPIDPVELAELLNRLDSLLLSSACA